MRAETSRIAFSRWTTGQHECLLVMRADGTGVEQLTRARQGDCYCPSWSPDGQRLCVASRRDGYSSLYLMDADGAAEQRLTYASGVDDDYPSWSPDGRFVAFSRANGGEPDGLWLVDVQSAEERHLTTNGRMDYRPTWSPDGRHIAFRRSLSGRPGVYVVPFCGGTARYVTRGRDPCWRPGGGWIALSHGESLWTIAVDGAGQPTGDPVQLTFHPRAVDRFPSWSPDGTEIAFEREEVRDEKVSCRIMTVSIDGAEPRDLGEGRMPDWSPVGHPNHRRER